MPHILIICTANVCRSPVAEALIRVRLAKKGLTEQWGWTVDSAGTWAKKVRQPSHFSCVLMEEQGIDITPHRAQMVDEALVENADLLLCMESGHVEALQVVFPQHRHKIRYFSEIGGRKYSITDPYGQPLPDYKIMVREVSRLLDVGMAKVVEWAVDTEEQPIPNF